jgi:predicted alpha/beta hydrolase
MQHVALKTADDVVISASFYQPAQATKRAILLAGATAVPQGFYRRFANVACDQGIAVLTLDYRGIGLSAPKKLRGYQADFLDWGRRDLTTALDYLAQRFELIDWIGHSFGGHALGMVHGMSRVRAAYVFGSGAGYHGYMPKLEQLRVRMLWDVVAPLSAAALGYLPFKLLGMGENIPKGVYQQWRKWCALPHYFFDDATAVEVTKPFADLRLPITFANATDDPWAPPASARAFSVGFSKADLRFVDIDPTPFRGIGHMGYFRENCSALWHQAIQTCAGVTIEPSS